MLSNIIIYYREKKLLMKEESVNAAIPRNSYSHLNLKQPPPDQSAALNTEARPSISKNIKTRGKLK